jgi:hypothetical protein
LIEFLLDGWEGALHNVDILFQIVQAMPDAAVEIRQWQIDILRVEATIDRFEPVREAAEAVFEGCDFGLSMKQLREQVNRSLT